MLEQRTYRPSDPFLAESPLDFAPATGSQGSSTRAPNGAFEYRRNCRRDSQNGGLPRTPAWLGSAWMASPQVAAPHCPSRSSAVQIRRDPGFSTGGQIRAASPATCRSKRPYADAWTSSGDSGIDLRRTQSRLRPTETQVSVSDRALATHPICAQSRRHPADWDDGIAGSFGLAGNPSSRERVSAVSASSIRFNRMAWLGQFGLIARMLWISGSRTGP